MPELPEVETVAHQLNKVLPGKVIVEAAGVMIDVVGREVERVGRKQKIIEIELGDDLMLLVHLKMTGQLIFQPAVEEGRRKKKEERIEQRIVGGSSSTALARLRLAGGHPTADWVGSLPSKHTRVTFVFKDESRLFFNDQRKFGWIRVMKKADWELKKQSMPPDVVDDKFTVWYLTQVLGRSRRAVKLVILDQAKIGGMGNIYACDALNMAGISPFMPANQLKARAVKKLYTAMKTVIERGIESGGASYSHFVGIEGMGGKYQEYFLVYDREGQACKNCGGVVQKVQLGGRGTYFCVNCQRMEGDICQK